MWLSSSSLAYYAKVLASTGITQLREVRASGFLRSIMAYCVLIDGVFTFQVLWLGAAVVGAAVHVGTHRSRASLAVLVQCFVLVLGRSSALCVSLVFTVFGAELVG